MRIFAIFIGLINLLLLIGLVGIFLMTSLIIILDSYFGALIIAIPVFGFILINGVLTYKLFIKKFNSEIILALGILTPEIEIILAYKMIEKVIAGIMTLG